MNDVVEVEKYIDGFNDETKQHLLAMRELIRNETPEATESMSYGLVGYTLNKKPLDQPLPIELIKRVVRYRKDQAA